jgi:hypothetical protein
MPSIARLLVDPDATPLLLCVDRAVTTWVEIARQVAQSFDREALVTPEPPPPDARPAWFDPTAIERVLGGPLDAREALREHLAWLSSPRSTHRRSVS